MAEEKKFVLSPKKYRGDNIVMSVRLPTDMIKKLDKLAEETGRSRNEIIQICLEFAIDNVSIEK